MALSQAASTQPVAQQKQAPLVILLPKGGGAIRGIGEKFAANPVTGTGSVSMPLATSPGRSGFGPQLPLSYDSGADNSPCGFRRSPVLPAVTRKTENGLLQHEDEQGSNIFVRSRIKLLQATDLTYSAPNSLEPGCSFYSYLVSAKQTGCNCYGAGDCISSSPPVDFVYAEATVGETVRYADHDRRSASGLRLQESWKKRYG